ncbi:MAG TPA: SH3 domain-containing protein [Terriglobales bacterium]|nr:SH3 domain-containing protein [Terriglobales bacterium]
MHSFSVVNQVARRAGLRLAVSICLFAAVFAIAGCSGSASEEKDYVYVAVPDASLRDRVATVYNKTGLVHNGERLQVLERMQGKRFVRVRTPRGEEGWIQERYLADQDTFDQFQQLAQQYASAPAQATATIQEQVKVHVEPGRKTGYLYLLNEKDKVELLKRAVAQRNASAQSSAREEAKDTKSKDKDKDSDDDEHYKSDQPAILEDWWLIRDQQRRVGWVYGRTLYLDVPEEIAQYSEGQRIVAAYPLDQIADGGTKVSEYLVLFTDNKDGMPYDFNQVRVFTWNVKRHRYETAYRERNISGLLPVTLGEQDFDKEGKLRVFTLDLKRDDGSARQQLYKYNPPLVHKVYAPGEEPPARTPRRKEAPQKARATFHLRHREG